jgi:hypothetical protein
MSSWTPMGAMHALDHTNCVSGSMSVFDAPRHRLLFFWFAIGKIFSTPRFTTKPKIHKTKSGFGTNEDFLPILHLLVIIPESKIFNPKKQAWRCCVQEIYWPLTKSTTPASVFQCPCTWTLNSQEEEFLGDMDGLWYFLSVADSQATNETSYTDWHSESKLHHHHRHQVEDLVALKTEFVVGLIICCRSKFNCWSYKHRNTSPLTNDLSPCHFHLISTGDWRWGFIQQIFCRIFLDFVDAQCTQSVSCFPFWTFTKSEAKGCDSEALSLLLLWESTLVFSQVKNITDNWQNTEKFLHQKFWLFSLFP